MNIPAEFTIATAEQSQQIDADTINDFGIDGFTLMEIAGTLAAQWLAKKWESKSHGIFFCGKGNNGGDALVAARYLVQRGICISIIFISGTDDLSPAAQKNYNLLRLIDKNDDEVDLTFINSWTDFDQSLQPDFIVDGMLGTGLNSDLRGDYIDAVKWINGIHRPTFALDIPTGLHADTGKIMGYAIRADDTFSFGTQKLGFYLEEGHEHAGRVHCFALPFPQYIMNQSSTYLIDDSWLPERTTGPARHKYEAGVVHIIAGSEGLTGAAIMAAKSIWAEGVGAVILVCPRGVLSIFENNLPQIIKKPVGKPGDFYFKEGHLSEISQIVAEKDGPILLGPGLGREETTANFVTRFLSRTKEEIIIDADGLWALSQQEKWIKPDDASWILTPHPGELSSLLNIDFESDIQRFHKVVEMAKHKNITLLSKGFPIILGTAKGPAYLSAYDTRIFSRAGFGDVLAGKIAAFSASAYSPPESCMKALLSGKKKAEAVVNQKNTHLEPFDLI